VEWFEIALRVLVIIGMATGAYRGYKQMRERGAWSTMAVAVSSLLLLVYLVGAVGLVAVYGIFMFPANLVVFVLATAVYLVGGLYLVTRAVSLLQTRYPPLARKEFP